MGPAIIVFRDCFTALGGNQYVNSSAIGDYADYLTREIIPFVDGEIHTLAGHGHRGCFGFVYWHDWPSTLNELAKYRAPKRKAGPYDARREARRKGLAQGFDDGRIKRFLQ